VRGFSLLKLYLLVFHNSDIFYLPPLLALALSVIINIYKMYASRVDPSV